MPPQHEPTTSLWIIQAVNIYPLPS
jgi:hypothetical protein